MNDYLILRENGFEVLFCGNNKNSMLSCPWLESIFCIKLKLKKKTVIVPEMKQLGNTIV